MIQEILDHAKISRDELMQRIRQKQDELSGFVTLEGAATIVGRELGVIFEKKEPEVRALHIEDLIPGVSKVDIVGRVIRIYGPREFQRQGGKVGRVGSLLLQDKTGQVRIALWDDKTPLIEGGKVRKGDAVQVKNAYVRQGLNKQPELSLGMRGALLVNPDDPRVSNLPPLVETKVRVADLKPELADVDIVGRVVTTSDIREFERPDGSKGKVASLILMDSTGQVRVSLWDERAELVKDLKPRAAVKLENASVRPGLREELELSLGMRGHLLLNPPESEVAKLPELAERPLKIGGLEVSMPTVDLAAMVRRKLPLQEFKRDDGTPGKVISVILADETGTTRASFWNGATDLAQKLKLNDIVVLHNAYTRAGLAGKPEVHVDKVARIDVNPPGVAVGALEPSRIKIGGLEPNMDALEVIGRVIDVATPREFTRADGSEGKVASIAIGDQTGAARTSLWHEHADKTASIKIGDIVRIINCYSTLGLFGQPELHLGKQGGLELNPVISEELPPVNAIKFAAPAPERVDIADVQKEGMRVQVRGTVTRVFHRRPVFDICPGCGRSLGSVDTSLMCDECGKVVTPEHRVVLSFVLDDGTDNLRVALFGKVAERLLGMGAQQVFELFKGTPDLAELYDKFKLTGRELVLTGTTRHDKYFDQLELRVSDVQFPEPKQEAQALLERIKAGM
jgi:replication factor A1